MIETQRIIASTQSVGTVPTAAAQVFSLISDANATAADFERVIRPDVGLTANLLRCANSAYYRATREITSVRDAISRMGLRRVFELAASASFAKSIPRALAGYSLDAKQYWDHSIAAAVLADRIGRHAGFTYPDLAFTAGLLHDIGKLVIANYLADDKSMLPTDDHAFRSVAEEQALLGVDHAALGEALGLSWSLPKDIAASARWHHNPLAAPTATLRSLAAVVQLADAAAHSIELGLEDEGAVPYAVAPEATLEHLGFETDTLAGLIERARPEIERTQEMLGSLSR
jgi:HD-like signal output (HDOD) protein